MTGAPSAEQMAQAMEYMWQHQHLMQQQVAAAFVAQNANHMVPGPTLTANPIPVGYPVQPVPPQPVLPNPAAGSKGPKAMSETVTTAVVDGFPISGS